MHDLEEAVVARHFLHDDRVHALVVVHGVGHAGLLLVEHGRQVAQDVLRGLHDDVVTGGAGTAGGGAWLERQNKVKHPVRLVQCGRDVGVVVHSEHLRVRVARQRVDVLREALRGRVLVVGRGVVHAWGPKGRGEIGPGDGR